MFGNSNHPENSRPVADLMIPGCLIVFFLARLFSFWATDVPHLVVQFEDDAYYYFKIARNIVVNHQVSFDSVTVTNGFHPLWMVLLLPIFAVVHDPLLGLRIAGSLSVILVLLGYWSAWRFLRPNFSDLTLSVIMAVALYYAHVFTRTGLDVSLVVTLAVWSLVLLAQMDLANPARTPISRFLLLGLLLAALELARLDTIILVLTVFLALIVSFRRSIDSSMLARLFATGCPPLVMGGMYLIVNYVWFGHLMPVSAASKSMSETPVNYIFLGQLVGRPLWILYSVTLALSVVALAMMVVNRRFQTAAGKMSDVAVVVAIFLVAYTATQLLLTSWFLWNWYCYPAFLATIFVLPPLIEGLCSRLEDWSGGIYRFLYKPALVSVLAAIVIQTAWQVFWPLRNVEHSFLYQNYVLARLLNQFLPDSPAVAMGDRAASFGYFYNGRVFQLEGLVGDYEFLKVLKQNELDNYLMKNGVGYVVSWTGPEKKYSKWELVTPNPALSQGPYSNLRLCAESEFLVYRSQGGTVFVWKWPGCQERGGKN